MVLLLLHSLGHVYALINLKPNLQHAIERAERPGGSHEGVGRKKWPWFGNDMQKTHCCLGFLARVLGLTKGNEQVHSGTHSGRLTHKTGIVETKCTFLCPSPLPFGGSAVLETYSSTTSRSRPRAGGIDPRLAVYARF